MDRKRFLLAVGIVSGVLLWLFSASVYLVIVRPRLEAAVSEPPPADLAYCAPEADALCVVSFGADRNDRMLINFMLPYPTYPLFHVQAQYAGTTAQYECRAAEEFPGSAYCSGPRIPLGEAVVIEVVSRRTGALLARGVFVISSIGLPTPLSVVQTPTRATVEPTGPPEFTPTFETPPPEPGLTRTPTATSGSYP